MTDAPRELNRLDVLRGLRTATWEASFATIWATLTTGAFLTGFALWIGAKDVEISFLTAIPTFAGLIQFVSSYFAERLPARKPISSLFFMLGRGLWLPILLLPIMLGPQRALYPFLLLFLLSYVALNIPMPAYMSWMSDLVPPDHRGRYFGRRNMIAGIVGMLIGLPAAWLLDYATRKTHQEAFGFATLFSVAIFGAVASFICMVRQPEPPKRVLPGAEDAPKGLAGVLDYYRAPFTDSNFRRLITFNVVLGLGQFFAAPFFTVYALQTIKLNYVTLQMLATLTSITSLASMPLWGYLADKFGNKPLLAISTFGTVLLPLYWVVTSRDNPTMMVILLVMNYLTGGAAWAGVGLMQFNLLIRLSPSDKTAVYVATMSAITGLTGGLAPLAGGMLMGVLANWHGQFLGINLLNFHIAFCVASSLRLVSLLFLRPLVDSQAASARDVLQQLTRADPRAWLHIRRLQRGSGMETRRRATEALGESRTQLAVDELKTALTDPALSVREEAARALGEIGDPAAVEALVTALHDPAAGMIEAVADALARIEDRSAVPALLASLNAGENTVSPLDRLAVIRALGALGGAEAANALMQQLEITQNEATVESLARALGDAGEPQASKVLVQRLEAEDASEGLRIAMVRALGLLGEESSSAILQQELKRSASDSGLLPATAEALGRIQDHTALPLLLARLTEADSPLARKQIALAVGTLLEESEELYSLLSQGDFARDEAVSKLVQELQRRLRGSSGAEIMEDTLSSYIGGEYVAFVRSLQETAEQLPPKEHKYAFQLTLKELAQQEYVSVEAALVSLIALRALTDE